MFIDELSKLLQKEVFFVNWIEHDTWVYIKNNDQLNHLFSFTWSVSEVPVLTFSNYPYLIACMNYLSVKFSDYFFPFFESTKTVLSLTNESSCYLLKSSIQRFVCWWMRIKIQFQNLF